MTNIEKIYKYVTDINSGKYPELLKQYNIVGAGFGPKFKSGCETNKTSVIFYVNKKKDLSNLNTNEIIPTHVNFEGINVVTDVVPSLSADTLVKCFADSGLTMPLSAHYKRRRPLQGGISSINGEGTQLYSTGTQGDASLGLIVTDKSDGQVVLLSNNHVYGDNIGHIFEHPLNGVNNDYKDITFGPQRDITKLTVKNPGTRVKFEGGSILPGGGMQINEESPSLGSMSYKSLHFPSSRSNDEFNGLRTGFYNVALSGSEGPNPLGNPELFQDLSNNIGTTKRVAYIGDYSFGYMSPLGDNITKTDAYEIYPIGSVDGAIASLSGYDLLDVNVSNQLLNFTEPGPYKFASKEEVLSLFDTTHVNYKSPLFRSGRRNGAVGKGVGGVGNGMPVACYNTVSEGVSASGSLSATSYSPAFVGFSNGNTYKFNENIKINSDNTQPLDSGDSGSVLFACLSSTVQSASAWKVVGLNYAGSFNGIGTGFAIPIHLVVEKLNIAPWNGVIPTLTATSESFTVKDNDVLTSKLNSSVAQVTASKYGQKYFLTNSTIKNENEPAFGDLKFGNIALQVDKPARFAAAEDLSLNTTFGKNIFSNSKGDVFAGTPHYFNKNLPLTNRLLLENQFSYGAVTNSGGGVIYKNNDLNKLEVIDFLKTPFLTATDIFLNDKHLFFGKDIIYDSNLDTSLSARFNSTYGSTSALFYTGRLSSYAVGSNEKQPLEGWGKFNLNRTPYSSNYGYEDYKGVASSEFFHNKLGHFGFMDDDYLFLISSGLPYTSFINTSGLQMSAFNQFKNVDNLKLYQGKQIINVPDDPINYPNVISEPLGEKGSSKVFVFDVNNNFTFTQYLTSKFRPGALSNVYGFERNQGVYKAQDGTLKYYYENPQLAKETTKIPTGSEVGDANNTNGQFIQGYEKNDRLIKRNGDYLVFTGVDQVEINKPSLGIDTFYVDIHKKNSDGTFTYHQQLTGSALNMGPINSCSETSFGSGPPTTYTINDGTVRLSYYANTLKIMNIEMTDDKLFVSLRNTGPLNTGLIQVFTRGDDDLYTFTNYLTAPILSSFGGLYEQHPNAHYDADATFALGQDMFGKDAQVLGDYLFTSQNIDPKYYDKTIPGAMTLFPGASSYLANGHVVTVTNLNNNTCVGVLTSNLQEISRLAYNRDLIFGPSETERTHAIYYGLNGQRNILTPLISNLGLINRQYDCGLIRRNDTKNKILRLHTSNLYNQPQSAFDVLTPIQKKYMSQNGQGVNGEFNHRISFYDLYELVDNVPTLTRRLSSYFREEGFAIAFLTDVENLGLNYIDKPVWETSFDDNYFYYPRKNHLGNKTGMNEISSGTVTNMRSDGFGRIRLDDDNYFKPISAYPLASTTAIGNYNKEILAPANSIGFGISSIPTYTLSSRNFPPFTGYEGAPGLV